MKSLYMRKVTIWRMRERYAQTVLTFRITYVNHGRWHTYSVCPSAVACVMPAGTTSTPTCNTPDRCSGTHPIHARNIGTSTTGSIFRNEGGLYWPYRGLCIGLVQPTRATRRLPTTPKSTIKVRKQEYSICLLNVKV